MRKIIAILIALAGWVAACESPTTPEEVERVTQGLYYGMSNFDNRWCGASGSSNWPTNANQYTNPGFETAFFFFEWSPDAGYGYCAKFGRFGFNMGQAWDTPPAPARINLSPSLHDQFSSMSIGAGIRVEIHWDTNGLGSAEAFECGDFCPGHWNLAASPLASWNDNTSSISYCRTQDKAANGWCPTF